MRSLGLALALSAAILSGTACGGKALGSEPSGRGIRAASSSNITTIPVAKRSVRPSFSGADLGGSVVTSSDLRGSPAVVNFWASWCGPCRVEQPTLERLWQRYESRGVKFLGVDIRDTRVDAGAHISEFKVTYPSVFSPDSSVAHSFRVSFIPTTYVLDRQGRVAAKIVGPVQSESALSAVLDRELGS